MGITYGSHDLVKRIIDGHNVEKVIYDGNQIWPSSPQPTYHIMGDFTQGSLPSGWSSTYGGVSYSNDGISLDPSGGTDHAIIKNQSSMPSLENASRIKIDYDFYRTNTGIDPDPFLPTFFLLGGLSYNDGSTSYARLESGISANLNEGYIQLWTAGNTSQRDTITTPNVGKYTLSIDVDLINKTATQILTYPNQTTSQLTGTITDSNVSSIRRSNEFTMSLYEGITMSDMNMYIWYLTPPTPGPWLCFTAEQNNSSVQLNKVGNPTVVSLETSLDGSIWSDYTIGDTITLSGVGDMVYFRNKSENPTGFSTGYQNRYYFSMSGAISASGDISYLLCKNGTTTVTSNCFTNLFASCASLTTAPSLPATTLANSCYSSMFSRCTSLTSAPALPATTLAYNCYYAIFYGCTSLASAPSLPATTLANYCYDAMFYGCTSLTSAPSLPATTLADYCYLSMFSGCSSLTTAPALPATTLAYECYRGMFGRTSLTTPPQLPATTLASGCYQQMFYGCTSLTTLPQLPATTLAERCYMNMFTECSLIKLSETQTGEYQTPYRIPTNGTGIAGTDSLSAMFTNTGGTFTGTPNINQTYYISNIVPPTYQVVGDFTNGSIPSGWSVSAPGGATYTLDSNGITWVGHQGSSIYEAGYMYIDNLPDLSQANKIVVEIGFTENNTGVASLFSGSGNFYTMLLGTESHHTLNTWIRGTVYTENISISNPYTGVLTTTYNLGEGKVLVDLGNLHYEYTMSSTSINALRNSSSFRVEASATDIYNITISSIDVSVWNV